MEAKDMAAKVKELWEYEFTDGEVTEKPIVIVGPDGSKTTMLRVYAYGGCIGRIATRSSDNHRLAEGTEYAGYLKKADQNYIQYMVGKYPDLENMPGNSAGEKLSRRLNDMLGQDGTNKDGLLFEAEYLDLILKAVKIKFTNENNGLMERNVQSAIVKKHMKNGPVDGWCIVDMEHAVTEDRKVIEKPDVVVYDKERGFGFIELKYDNRSTENLDKHYEKTKNLMENAAAEKIIKELKRRSRYLMDYGLANMEFFEMIDKDSHSKLWHGFLFIGGKKADAVRNAKLIAQKHGEIEENENCLFWWFPNADDSSLNNIDLHYSLENTYKEFVKKGSGSDHS